MKKEEGNEPSTVYEDFEPHCDWKLEVSGLKETDLLDIRLQGFKKEELKLEIPNGVLYISGEQPERKGVKKRFKKKIDVSKYEIKEIEPKFEDGIIRVRLPKKTGMIRFCRKPPFVCLCLRLDSQAFMSFPNVWDLLLLLPVIMCWLCLCCYVCTNSPRWFSMK